MSFTVDVEFSWRYGVMGVYKDRAKPVVRIYPLPFVRITVEWPRPVILCD